MRALCGTLCGVGCGVCVGAPSLVEIDGSVLLGFPTRPRQHTPRARLQAVMN